MGPVEFLFDFFETPQARSKRTAEIQRLEIDLTALYSAGSLPLDDFIKQLEALDPEPISLSQLVTNLGNNFL